ncbi:hypothetical protein GcM1_187018 [Golovinomyces cichoracearum]|uniref:Uncharacterized protein n=1 Tax=Golovinomyces cichoracearum TaxID=62708 RepID=A0A420J2K0_9PEZI|nr:hypothetical protein GcM1_187018 [Golovinomyces cichoracearum]
MIYVGYPQKFICKHRRSATFQLHASPSISTINFKQLKESKRYRRFECDLSSSPRSQLDFALSICKDLFDLYLKLKFDVALLLT